MVKRINTMRPSERMANQEIEQLNINNSTGSIINKLLGEENLKVKRAFKKWFDNYTKKAVDTVTIKYIKKGVKNE